MSDLSIDQEIESFLAISKTASLATVDAHGLPCAANIQYAHDKAWKLYWVSSMSSAHSVNVGAKPQAAVTIYAQMDSPESIHGLQMRGQVALIDDDELEDALSLYIAKYPFVAEPPFSDAIKRQRFYRFVPTWLRWIDNRKGFGWKVEKTIER